MFPPRWMRRKRMKPRSEIGILHTLFRGQGDWNPLPLLLQKFTAGSF
jgi:hypothetical protein